MRDIDMEVLLLVRLLRSYVGGVEGVNEGEAVRGVKGLENVVQYSRPKCGD